MFQNVSTKTVFSVLAAILLLLVISLFADKKAVEVQGPTRMVRGPQDTLYVKIDDQIVKVSADGDVLGAWDIRSDLAIHEPVVDFFVDADGRLMIARGDSQLIQYYSPEGKLLRTHVRLPSPVVEDRHSIKFTKDPVTGTVYVADTSHHRIQIYGADEKEFRMLTAPLGAKSTPLAPQAHSDESLEASILPERPFLYPNGILFDNDKLFVTDTYNHRIVVLNPDGSFDKIIPTIEKHYTRFVYPVKLARAGASLFVINKGELFMGGEVVAIDTNTLERRRFHSVKKSNPEDVLARADDVLVTDRATLNIHRYTHGGRLLGMFGGPSLSDILMTGQATRKIYEWTRVAAIGGMVLVLAALFVSSRRQRIAAEKAGGSFYKPFQSLQKILGPPDGARRRIILFLIPGLGQAAAGRVLRAFTFLAVLFFLLSACAYVWHEYHRETATGLPSLLAICLDTYILWIVITLDGIRLSGAPNTPGKTFNFRQAFITVLLPLIAVVTGIMAQVAREIIMHDNPEISLFIQSLFRDVLIGLNRTDGPDAAFAAATAASMLFGWGGAVAGFFGVLAWRLGLKKVNRGFAVIGGFCIGILSWAVTGIVAGPRLGAMFYMPPTQGAILGLFVYIFFKKYRVPAFVIPVAIAGAWLGHILMLITGALMRPVFYSSLFAGSGSAIIGAFTRTNLIVWEIYGIFLATLTVLNLSTKQREIPVQVQGE